MPVEIGRIRVEDVDATAPIPPEGSLLYARDTDKIYVSDGTSKTELASGGGPAYTDLEAQDAVGGILADTPTVDLTYVSGVSIEADVKDNSITNAKLRDSSGLSVVGRSANSSGDPGDIVGSAVGSVLQVLPGPTVGFRARKYSWENPPVSPSVYDDEFDSTTLDAKWTPASVVGSFTSGSIDYSANLTDPIYDLTTCPGWLMMQSGSTSVASGSIATLTQSYSPSTDGTFFVRMGVQSRGISASNEGAILFKIFDSTDTDEYIQFGLARSTGNAFAACYVSNNGVLTSGSELAGGNGNVNGPFYIACWKKGNVYRFGHQHDGATFSYFGLLTKTGVVDFDRIQILFYNANETPSWIDGVDFIRYKPSLDYGLMNP
jgi:hypothetical protein